MARTESIVHIPYRCVLADGEIRWEPVQSGRAIEALPQIIWRDSTPWREANLWAHERATSRHATIKTVLSNTLALRAYANWLEETDTKWWEFPRKKAERCLVRYRSALIEARDKGQIAPTTTSQRMAVVVQFYRWLHAEGMISPEWPMWRERTIGIRLTDPVGFTRTIMVASTDLAITNRRAPGYRLEDGLLPVSIEHREEITEFAKKYASEELFLMLTTGFATGMRLGTLADLKIQSLERAVPDPSSPELFRIAVGPGADPPVHTKGGVTGQIHITRANLEALREYFYSARRLKRQALAKPQNSDLLFLTRFGNPYAERGSDKSPAINVAMHSLREKGKSQGLKVLRHFHFHQTRCTFATELARLAISAAGAINALAIVKEFLLHKNEASSLRYIKFVEQTPAKVEAANAFTREFLGAMAPHR